MEMFRCASGEREESRNDAVTRTDSAERQQRYGQITPGVRSGKPCIAGTRITPTDVLEYLAGGMTEDEILKDFPSLTRDHILAVLAYAAERERRYASYTAA
jgi:uncharacterized protein (DUF433 family)